MTAAIKVGLSDELVLVVAELNSGRPDAVLLNTGDVLREDRLTLPTTKNDGADTVALVLNEVVHDVADSGGIVSTQAAVFLHHSV